MDKIELDIPPLTEEQKSKLPLLNEEEDLYGDSRDYPDQYQMEIKARTKANLDSLPSAETTKTPEPQPQILTNPQEFAIQESEEIGESVDTMLFREKVPEFGESARLLYDLKGLEADATDKIVNIKKERVAIVSSLTDILTRGGYNITYDQLSNLPPQQRDQHPAYRLLQNEQAQFAMSRLEQIDGRLERLEDELVPITEEKIKMLRKVKPLFDESIRGEKEEILHLAIGMTEDMNSGLISDSSEYKDAVYLVNDILATSPTMMYAINGDENNSHPLAFNFIGKSRTIGGQLREGVFFRILNISKSDKAGQPVYDEPFRSEDFVNGWDLVENAVKNNPTALALGVVGEVLGGGAYLGATKFVAKRVAQKKLAEALTSRAKGVGVPAVQTTEPTGLNWLALSASGSVGAGVGEYAGSHLDSAAKNAEYRKFGITEIDEEVEEEQRQEMAEDVIMWTFLGNAFFAGGAKVVKAVKDSDPNLAGLGGATKRFFRNGFVPQGDQRRRLKTLYEDWGIDVESDDYKAVQENRIHPRPCSYTTSYRAKTCS